jgi:hypothetical protein
MSPFVGSLWISEVFVAITLELVPKLLTVGYIWHIVSELCQSPI